MGGDGLFVRVGCGVGACMMVGFGVGCGTGACVGGGVGSGVGSGDGAGVGSGEGDGVGRREYVGTKVGRCVGDGVGSSVGPRELDSSNKRKVRSMVPEREGRGEQALRAAVHLALPYSSKDKHRTVQNASACVERLDKT